MIVDTTMQGIVDVLKGSPSLLCISDELTQWINGMCRRGGKQSSERQFWLSLWSGSAITVNRRSYNLTIIIFNPRVSVLGGIQPQVLFQVGNDVHDGLIDRFFFVEIERTGRAFSVSDVPSELTEKWDNHLCSLLKQSPQIDQALASHVLSVAKASAAGRASGDAQESETGCDPEFTRDEMLDEMLEAEAFYNKSEEQITLTLTSEAQSAFGRWYEMNDPMQAPAYLQGFANKLAGYALRIALNLHYLQHGTDATNIREIDTETTLGAIQLAEWLGLYTFRARSKAAARLSKRSAAVLRWVKRKGGAATATDVVTGRVSGIANVNEAKSTFAELSQAGLGEIRTETTPAGRKREAFHVADSVASPA